MTALTAWTLAQSAARPLELKALKKIWRAMLEADERIVEFYDGQERDSIEDREDMLNIAFNLDEVFFYSKSGSWVRLVFGEEVCDMVADYTVDLEAALAPFYEWAELHSN